MPLGNYQEENEKTKISRIIADVSVDPNFDENSRRPFSTFSFSVPASLSAPFYLRDVQRSLSFYSPNNNYGEGKRAGLEPGHAIESGCGQGFS